MRQVYVGVGSNQQPHHYLQMCLHWLAREFEPLDISRVFDSEPVGFCSDNFLNCVVGFDCPLSLGELQTKLRNFELAQGRPPNAQKKTARTIDIDILLFKNLCCIEPIVLPRPEIRYHAFVLWPLSELIPEYCLPGETRPLSALWQSFDSAHVLTPIAFETT